MRPLGEATGGEAGELKGPVQARAPQVEPHLRDEDGAAEAPRGLAAEHLRGGTRADHRPKPAQPKDHPNQHNPKTTQPAPPKV